MKGQDSKFYCLRGLCIALISDSKLELNLNGNKGNTVTALDVFVNYINKNMLFLRHKNKDNDNYITDYKLTDEKKTVNNKGKKVYRTNPVKLLEDNILEKYDYKCSCHTPEHLYFTSNTTKNNYLEFHHLIPFANQEFYLSNFNIDLDVKHNLVPLCPHCHMLLHHAIAKEKAELIKYLYDKHMLELKKVDPNINLFRLMEFYNVFLVS